MEFLAKLSRTELQALAKKYGVKANAKSETIRTELLAKSFSPLDAVGGTGPAPAVAQSDNLHASTTSTEVQGRRRRKPLHVAEEMPPTHHACPGEAPDAAAHVVQPRATRGRAERLSGLPQQATPGPQQGLDESYFTPSSRFSGRLSTTPLAPPASAFADASPPTLNCRSEDSPVSTPPEQRRLSLRGRDDATRLAAIAEAASAGRNAAATPGATAAAAARRRSGTPSNRIFESALRDASSTDDSAPRRRSLGAPPGLRDAFLAGETRGTPPPSAATAAPSPLEHPHPRAPRGYRNLNDVVGRTSSGRSAKLEVHGRPVHGTQTPSTRPPPQLQPAQHLDSASPAPDATRVPTSHQSNVPKRAVSPQAAAADALVTAKPSQTARVDGLKASDAAAPNRAAVNATPQSQGSAESTGSKRAVRKLQPASGPTVSSYAAQQRVRLSGAKALDDAPPGSLRLSRREAALARCEGDVGAASKVRRSSTLGARRVSDLRASTDASEAIRGKVELGGAIRAVTKQRDGASRRMSASGDGPPSRGSLDQHLRARSAAASTPFVTSDARRLSADARRPDQRSAWLAVATPEAGTSADDDDDSPLAFPSALVAPGDIFQCFGEPATQPLSRRPPPGLGGAPSDFRASDAWPPPEHPVASRPHISDPQHGKRASLPEDAGAQPRGNHAARPEPTRGVSAAPAVRSFAPPAQTNQAVSQRRKRADSAAPHAAAKPGWVGPLQPAGAQGRQQSVPAEQASARRRPSLYEPRAAPADRARSVQNRRASNLTAATAAERARAGSPTGDFTFCKHPAAGAAEHSPVMLTHETDRLGLQSAFRRLGRADAVPQPAVPIAAKLRPQGPDEACIGGSARANQTQGRTPPLRGVSASPATRVGLLPSTAESSHSRRHSVSVSPPLHRSFTPEERAFERGKRNGLWLGQKSLELEQLAEQFAAWKSTRLSGGASMSLSDVDASPAAAPLEPPPSSVAPPSSAEIDDAKRVLIEAGFSVTRVTQIGASRALDRAKENRGAAQAVARCISVPPSLRKPRS